MKDMFTDSSVDARSSCAIRGCKSAVDLEMMRRNMIDEDPPISYNELRDLFAFLDETSLLATSAITSIP